ncbi:dethiobiotin synthase [Alishewanella sp. 16-MA]|uniref:ATP-dependent dethiobiotin synthetase BioD n=1 Tax=Alishewanella maricola TaxID=2795740 RepID=A0ABS8C5J2_9ALTE|nr:dethiobiotin synthase [Alishewanella maricola]MCB5227561.1 dethiobiotin synthase [Alishewanella maricola]
MRANSFFVTGTDTDAGKTFVSTLLLQGFQSLGISAVGAKPIAAGAEINEAGQLVNSDALLLQRHSGIALPYSQLNPLCFAKACAPHFAAAELQQPLSEAVLSAQRQQLEQSGAEIVLIEGAGGWLLPISADRYLADWVQAENLPVLLVVGVKLGCLNHAVLTARELTRSGCQVIGWVANILQPEMLFLAQNLADLTARLPWPLLATVPFQPSVSEQQAVARTLAHATAQQLMPT